MASDRSPRQKLLDLLEGRPSGEALVSPLIDGTYAAGVAGKEWVSEATTEDLLLCAELGGYEPLIGVGTGPGDPDDGHSGLRWDAEILEQSADSVRTRRTLHTPWGDLHQVELETKGMSTWLVEPLLKEWAPEIVEWYAAQLVASPEARARRARRVVQKVGERGLVYDGANMPFEMFGLYRDENLIYYSFDHPKEWRRVSEVIFETTRQLIEISLRAGVSAIFFGPYGTEFISPALFEREYLPYLKACRDLIHRLGGFSYMHSCSKQKLFIARGYYDHFEPDLFETLAPPPTGDIDDLAEARRQLSPRICTKGNIDLGLLRNGTAGEVASVTRTILEATRGYRHIVGTADAVLPGTPMENIRSMVETAKTWRS